jgi:hypothetical protein
MRAQPLAQTKSERKRQKRAANQRGYRPKGTLALLLNLKIYNVIDFFNIHDYCIHRRGISSAIESTNSKNEISIAMRSNLIKPASKGESKTRHEFADTGGRPRLACAILPVCRRDTTEKRSRKREAEII